MSKRPIANPLALAVLSCLWERPMYPYEMTTSLRERGKEDSIRLNFGSLYAVIKSLEKHGLIVATHTERDGNRPERIVYDITESGKAEAVDWLRELIATPAKEYPAFETGLSLLAMLTPADATELLRERLTCLDADLTERAATASSALMQRLPELFIIEFHYRVAMIEAERSFVAAMIERIESGSFGGMDGWGRLHELLAAGRSREEIAREIAKYAASFMGEEATKSG
jgi:DNA-binding PadR family transcriptional regulator